MKAKTLRLFALILAILSLTVALFSCTISDKGEDNGESNETEQTDESDVESESETESRSAVENTGLEIRDDLKGQTMNIWYTIGTRTWGPNPMSVSQEEAANDEISQAGYNRNAALEAQLGIYIDFTAVEGDPNRGTALTALRTLYTSGDTRKYDMIITGARVCGAMAQEGLYYDLSDSRYIKPDAYYYEAQVNEQMKVYDSMYYACGYFSVGNTRSLNGIFANKKLLNEWAGVTDMNELYELAFDKKWTFETMLTYGKKFSNPSSNALQWADGQTPYSPDGWKSYEGQYAFVSSGGDARALYYALGGTVIEQIEGEYTVTMDNSVNTNLITYLREQMTPNGTEHTAMLSDDTFVKSFTEGHTMFLMASFSAIDDANGGIANQEGLDWGLMPPPLKDEGDDYRTFSDSWTLVFAGIPDQCRDLDKATYLYEMFMAQSYDYLYPAYYEKAFRTSYQADSSSVKVFDLIAKSRTICFRDVYQIGGATVLDGHRAYIWGQGSIGDITTMADSVRTSLNEFISNVGGE